MSLIKQNGFADRLRRVGRARLKALRVKEAAAIAALSAQNRADAQAAEAFKNSKVLNRYCHDPKGQIDLEETVIRVIALAQAMSETKFYPYQVELGSRIVESLLEHDGDVITGLMARQAGKTSVLSAIVAAISVIFPELAKKFPLDWRLNTTDDNGVYRGFAHGIRIGIYAPKLDQSAIMFERVRLIFATDTAKQILTELGLSSEMNGGRIRFSNSSHILCESASDQSKIEGETHNLLIAEEAQDISDKKMRKSLHPMTAATNGTIVKIGTAKQSKCDFYESIQTNERMELSGAVRNHFCFPYQVVIKYNSFYRDFLAKESIRLGEDSDEFRTSYKCEWLFERGMFVTQPTLFNFKVAQRTGFFARQYPLGLPEAIASQFSIVAGIDWGASHDCTVLTMMAVNWNAPLDSGIFYDADGQHAYTYYKKHVISWLEFKGDNYEHQFHEIVQYLSGYRNLAKIVTDANTCGKPIYDRLDSVFSYRGIQVDPFTFQVRSKADGYRSLYGDICAGRVTFPAGDGERNNIRYRKFVRELLDLRKEYRNGLMHVAHPDERGAHDDYPDSFMLAAWGANQPCEMFGGIEVGNENNLFIHQ